MFRGDDISKLNCGEWVVVGTSGTAGEYAHVAEAILDINIFQREYDYEGDGCASPRTLLELIGRLVCERHSGEVIGQNLVRQSSPRFKI